MRWQIEDSIYEAGLVAVLDDLCGDKIHRASLFETIQPPPFKRAGPEVHYYCQSASGPDLNHIVEASRVHTESGACGSISWCCRGKDLYR